MERGDWIERYSSALGTSAPSPSEMEDLLALAGAAAHASERTSAPLSTWLAGRSSLPIAVARQLAEELAESSREGRDFGGS
jgi:hypothetical protein